MKLVILLSLISSSVFAKDWNVRTNPFTLLLGAQNLQANYAVLENVSIGLGGLVWKAEVLDVKFRASEVHLRADYWWNNPFEQGNYIGLQISRLNMGITSTVNDVDFDGDISSTGYLGHFGHHWQWDSFNLALGTYLGVYDFDKEIELEDSNGNKREESVPAFGAWGLEFFIGWAF